MSKIIRWKIWYDNREPFSSSDGPPEKAPLDGVQLIIQWRENGTREILHTNNYFIWLGTEWRDYDLCNLEKWLRKEVPQLKFGRWMTAEEWRKLKEVAINGE